MGLSSRLLVLVGPLLRLLTVGPLTLLLLFVSLLTAPLLLGVLSVALPTGLLRRLTLRGLSSSLFVPLLVIPLSSLLGGLALGLVIRLSRPGVWIILWASVHGSTCWPALVALARGGTSDGQIKPVEHPTPCGPRRASRTVFVGKRPVERRSFVTNL